MCDDINVVSEYGGHFLSNMASIPGAADSAVVT